MNNFSSTEIVPIKSLLRHDWFLLLCLLISVSHIFFQWYEVFFIVPVFIMLLSRPLSKPCRRTATWLFLFSVSYLIGCHFHGGIGSRTLYVVYLFPPLFYMAGSYIGSTYKWSESTLVTLLFSLLLMYAIYDLVQMLYFLFSGEGVIISNRNILDESGDITHGATGYAMLLSVLICGLAFLFTPRQEGILRWIRIVGLILGALALYGMASIVTRTSIVEAAIVLLFSLIMTIIDNNKQRNMIGLVLGLFVFILVVYFLKKTSLLSQYFEAYQMRLENETYGYDNVGGRSMRWWAGLRSLLSNPFGTSTGRIQGFGLNNAYAHNMWLDVGLRSGWFPFIILLVLSIRNVHNSIRLLKDKSYQYFTRLYFFAVFLVFVLSCFVEPVLDGVYNHFLVYLVFCGMVSEMKPKTIIDKI